MRFDALRRCLWRGLRDYGRARTSRGERGQDQLTNVYHARCMTVTLQFGEAGDIFDPNRHEAMFQAPNPDFGPGQVSQVCLAREKKCDRQCFVSTSEVTIIALELPHVAKTCFIVISLVSLEDFG